MKIKLSELRKLIKEALLQEEPQMWDHKSDTIHKNLYQNKLNHEKSQPSANSEHEDQRLKELLFTGNGNQYLNRLTKITNPQKMVGAYKALNRASEKYAKSNAHMKRIKDAKRKVVTYLQTNKLGSVIQPQDKNLL
jgi:hypothetical protein